MAFIFSALAFVSGETTMWVSDGRRPSLKGSSIFTISALPRKLPEDRNSTSIFLLEP